MLTFTLCVSPGTADTVIVMLPPFAMPFFAAVVVATAVAFVRSGIHTAALNAAASAVRCSFDARAYHAPTSTENDTKIMIGNSASAVSTIR